MKLKPEKQNITEYLELVRHRGQVKTLLNGLFFFCPIAKKLGMSNSTVKRMLDKLITLKLIERQGVGPGSYYNVL